jgi:septum formation protein
VDEPAADEMSARLGAGREKMIDRPAALAEAISLFKARSVGVYLAESLLGAELESPSDVILGADTVVALEDQIFGKPRDLQDARRILSTLMGTTHDVVTGVTLLDCLSGRRQVTHDVTRVTMRRLSGRNLAAYLESGAWRGKAGAFGIQDAAGEFIANIKGSFTNVMGLPMERVAKLLAEIGILPNENAPEQKK